MTFCWILWLWDDLGSDEAYFELFFDFNPQTFSKYVLFFFFLAKVILDATCHFQYLGTKNFLKKQASHF